MRYAILAVFGLVYIGISAQRVRALPIGRPSFSLVGASTLVVLGLFAGPVGLKPDEALAAVEPHTISLLFGMMVVSSGLAIGGFFDVASVWIARHARSPARLLWIVTIGCGVLSAVLMNDAVCLLATPLVVMLAERLRANKLPLALGVAMGSNAGSALTLGGNPQNMLVARLSGLSYRAYAFHAAVPTAFALVATAGLLHAIHRKSLAAPTVSGADAALDARAVVLGGAPPKADRIVLGASLLATVGIVVANLAGANLAWSAIVGASVVIASARERAEELLEKVDFTVLIFFAGLFIVVAALQKTGLPGEWLGVVAKHPIGQSRYFLAGTLALGAQVVSNVPLIMLLEPWLRTLPNPDAVWTETAIVTTLAGNLTLLGSVANVIVVERAGIRIGFWGYLRAGLPISVVTLAVALLVLR